MKEMLGGSLRHANFTAPKSSVVNHELSTDLVSLFPKASNQLLRVCDMNYQFLTPNILHSDNFLPVQGSDRVRHQY